MGAVCCGSGASHQQAILPLNVREIVVDPEWLQHIYESEENLMLAHGIHRNNSTETTTLPSSHDETANAQEDNAQSHHTEHNPPSRMTTEEDQVNKQGDETTMAIATPQNIWERRATSSGGIPSPRVNTTGMLVPVTG
jgi:hypothetical protein